VDSADFGVTWQVRQPGNQEVLSETGHVQPGTVIDEDARELLNRFLDFMWDRTIAKEIAETEAKANAAAAVVTSTVTDEVDPDESEDPLQKVDLRLAMPDEEFLRLMNASSPSGVENKGKRALAQLKYYWKNIKAAEWLRHTGSCGYVNRRSARRSARVS